MEHADKKFTLKVEPRTGRRNCLFKLGINWEFIIPNSCVAGQINEYIQISDRFSECQESWGQEGEKI